MHLHPEIAALRSDRAVQRRIEAHMQGALAEWKDSEKVRALAQCLELYAEGQDFAECGELGHCLTEHAVGMSYMKDWLARLVAALRKEPLGEVPHVYRYSAGLSRMQLLVSGRASLSLVAYERHEDRRAVMPDTVLFSDIESHEIVLFGSAQGTFHRFRESGAIHTERCRWVEGDRIDVRRDCARQVSQVHGSMLVLQLTRLPERPQPTRELRLRDGALVRSASGDKSASQRLMALAVLGAMEHSPAIAAMKASALDRGEDADVRWEAVRQVLALAPLEGLAILRQLAAFDHDVLQRPAADLARNVIAAHPSLARAA